MMDVETVTIERNLLAEELQKAWSNGYDAALMKIKEMEEECCVPAEESVIHRCIECLKDWKPLHPKNNIKWWQADAHVGEAA